MKLRPEVVAFDVLETLFSLEPMRAKLIGLGLPSEALELWFARLLRNAFALDASGTFKPFAEIASGTLEVMLAGHQISADVENLTATLAEFSELPAHTDVLPAFQMLQKADICIVALTNGSADITRKLLQRADLMGFVERIVSIDEIRRWKPNPEVYVHAAKELGVPTKRLALVAAHAWDIHGASQAGLVTGWVSRLEVCFDPAMNPPDVSGDTLDEVCQRLLNRRT